MSATIRDISKETGLSLATISKYLNGGNVRPENKEKIEKAVNRLHYEVNEIARSLVTRKTRTIGIIVYNIQCVFVGELLHSINNLLGQKGYGLLICDSSNDEKKEVSNVKFLLNKKVDGIIVIPVSNDSNFLNSAKIADIPVILIDRSLKKSEFDCVKIDNRQAALEAVNFLIMNHHKKIAIIYDNHVYTGSERYKGYWDAMKQLDFNVPVSYQKKGTNSLECGYESMKQLLKLKNPPTAVFMTNYELTLGAVMAVNESAKFNCPDNISLVGFDNLIMVHAIQPKMTVVIQPVKAMGEKAVERILKRIDGSHELPIEINMSTQIKKGNSVKDFHKTECCLK